MEKISFTNGVGDSIELASWAPYVLQRITGTGGLVFNVQTEKSPFQDGETYLDSIADKRDISLQIALLATQLELYECKRELQRIFNPKLGKGLLRYENDLETKVIEVYLEGGPAYASGDRGKGNGYQVVLVSMVAVEPFWMDITPTNEILAKVIPRFHFALDIIPGGIEMGTHSEGRIVIDNDGDVGAPLRFEFYGPVVDPRITNLTTGEFIELITPLAADEKMIITTDFGNKRAEIHKENGDIINAFQYINLESTFFQLQRGENILAFDAAAGSTEATIEISYRKRYIGL